MTTKNANAKKTNAKKSVGLTEQEILAQEVGQLVGERDTINANMDIKCAMIRKLRKGKPIGTQTSDCAVMKRFLESQIARGLKEQTIKNNCTTFRKAVNEGKPYDVNASRKASKAKGAKQKGSVVPDVKVILSGEPDEAFVAKKLREIFNGWKKKEKNLSLVGYLLDGLDDFEG